MANSRISIRMARAARAARATREAEENRARSETPENYATGNTFIVPPMEGDTIRIGVFSDTHCGHCMGLTPVVDYWKPLESEDPAIRLLGLKQREMWNAYKELIAMAGPVNHIIFNGDGVDGNGFRLDGAEMICESHDQMAEMSGLCIKEWITPGITTTAHIIGGTPSHTWFGPIDVDKLAKDHVITKCANVTYDQAAIIQYNFKGIARPFRVLARHDTPKGSIQTGGAGPGAIRQSIRLEFEMLYNGYLDLRPDVFLFSHSHEAHAYHQPLAGHDKYVIVTPCLQAAGSVYGRTKCSGTITWGITVLELKLVNGEIHFSHKFLTRNLIANRPVVNNVTYA